MTLTVGLVATMALLGGTDAAGAATQPTPTATPQPAGEKPATAFEAGRYVITLAGPEPLEVRSAAIDYEHYLARQLQPVADAILPFVGDDFSALTSRQQNLF